MPEDGGFIGTAGFDAKPAGLRTQPLPATVMQARVKQREADTSNLPIVEPRIAAHLAVHDGILDSLRGEHARLVDETNFDPLRKTRQAAAWLLAGRCLSLGYGVTAMLRANLTTEVAPLARTLYEASGALRIMLDSAEPDLHRKWLGDGYFSPNVLERAQKRMEDRQAAAMLRHGVVPPGRTREDGHWLYGEWSRIAHNRRSGVLENYSPPLWEFAYGPHPDPLRRGLWTGYGSEVLYEVLLSVGAMLTKAHGPKMWMCRIEPAVDVLQRLREQHPLDPAALGFRAPDAA